MPSKRCCAEHCTRCRTVCPGLTAAILSQLSCATVLEMDRRFMQFSHCAQHFAQYCSVYLGPWFSFEFFKRQQRRQYQYPNIARNYFSDGYTTPFSHCVQHCPQYCTAHRENTCLVCIKRHMGIFMHLYRYVVK